MNWKVLKLIAVASLACAGLSGCGLPGSPPPAATPTVPPPAATPAPTATPLPATPTYTPVPTLTPVPLGANLGGAPTPTWTPVPGNPRWSIWEGAGLVFRLPVTWRKAPLDPPGGSMYDGPGGPDRPQLLLRVEEAPAETSAQAYAGEAMRALGAELARFKLLGSGGFDLGGLAGRRYAYTAEDGLGRRVRGVAFFAVGQGRALTLRFVADERNAAEWEETFDRIAASARFADRRN